MIERFCPAAIPEIEGTFPITPMSCCPAANDLFSGGPDSNSVKLMSTASSFNASVSHPLSRKT